MRAKRLAFTVALAIALLATPAVPAGWRGLEARNDGAASDEPNTIFDVAGAPSGAVMWQTPNLGATERVYFDVAMVEAPAVVSGPYLNYNYGTSSRMTGFSNYYHIAMLGFWRDCNGDGFIGNALTGQREYPVLSAPPNCPYPYTQTVSSAAGTFLVVDEFRAIGDQADCQTEACNARFRLCGPTAPPVCAPVTYPFRNDAADVSDSDARVWGDWRLPTQTPLPSQGLLPWPPGTWQSTNGHTRWVDDATVSHMLSSSYDAHLSQGSWTRRPCAGENRPDVDADTASCNELANDPTQPSHRNSVYPLAVVRWRYNDAESDQGHGTPLVKVWDCEPGQYRYNPGPVVFVPAMRMGSLDFSGSIVGTYDHLGGIGDPTSGSAGRCTQGQSQNEVRTLSTWQRDVTYANLESESQRAKYEKNRPDQVFSFGRDSETIFPLPTGINNPTCNGATSCIFDNNHGLWYGNFVFTRRPPRHGFGLIDRPYFTAYADVTVASGVNLPAGFDNAHTYGVESCPVGGNGVVNGWVCSRSLWTHAQPGLGRILHDKYDLRDIDCFDFVIGMGMVRVRPTGAGSCGYEQV